MDDITKNTFIYDACTNRVTKAHNMLHERYTFCCVLRKNYVYAIGGRTYGEDDIAIHKNCERFDLKKRQWEEIANLNIGRCSAMATNYQLGILVIGGYEGQGYRSNICEIYSEYYNQWEIHQIQLEEGIEAGFVEMVSDSKILVFGGRTDQGDSNLVYAIDLIYNSVEVVGEMGNKKCLHKVYKPKTKFQDYMLILGGEDNNSIECYSLKKNKIEQIQALNQMIEDFKFEIEITVTDIQLKKYLIM